MRKRIAVGIGLLVTVIMIFNIKIGIGHFFPTYYSEAVTSYSDIYGIDSCLVYSIIKVESEFKTEAQSNKGAIGLMQIMPKTGEYISGLLGEQQYNESQLFTPEVNIRYGTYYFSKLYKDFDENVEMAISAYNAGEGNVRKWVVDEDGYRYFDVKAIPFTETKAYLKKVKVNQIVYEYLYEDDETIFNLVSKLSKILLYEENFSMNTRH